MVDGTEQALAFGSEKRPFTPTHVSHKQVEAYPLVGLAEEEGGHLVAIVKSDGGERRFVVPSNIIARGYPKSGDMLVRYAPTASDPEYFSFSPREAFETGYSAIRPVEHRTSDALAADGRDLGATINGLFAAFRAELKKLGDSRELSVALTHLDTARLWAREHAAR